MHWLADFFDINTVQYRTALLMGTFAVFSGLLWKIAPKVATVSIVLMLITAAVDYGSPVLAAIGATAPVTIPFSLYIVVQNAGEELVPVVSKTNDEAAHAAQAVQAAAAALQVETFLLLACKGMVATLAWCAGAYIAARNGAVSVRGRPGRSHF